MSNPIEIAKLRLVEGDELRAIIEDIRCTDESDLAKYQRQLEVFIESNAVDNFYRGRYFEMNKDTDNETANIVPRYSYEIRRITQAPQEWKAETVVATNDGNIAERLLEIMKAEFPSSEFDLNSNELPF